MEYASLEHTVVPKRPLVRVNHLLSWVVVLFGLYLVSLPLLPHVHFYLYLWHKKPVEAHNITLSPRVAQAVNPEEGVVAVPTDNRLQIDTIGVDGTVFEGKSVNTLSKGIWRRPLTSTPDKGGNTVLVAHRYLYHSGPNTFYLLDKVSVGQDITLWWEGKKYLYTISEVKIVEPDAVEIEKPTPDARLTLYTCTPLFSASKRLVVIAVPKSS